MNHFNLAKPTFIENWPGELCSLSIAQSNIVLSLDSMEAFMNKMWESKNSPYLDIIAEKLDDELQKFPKGVFIRLGSRSPKDVEIKPIFNGKEGLNLLLNSTRVFDDLCESFQNKYESNIFCRDWVEIPEWSEFRCFMKDRKLIGVSQYNYLKGVIYPEIKENEECIKIAIAYFFDYFKGVSHLDTVIFDVFLTYKKNINNSGIWEIKLLEINPFFEMTDPCLFDWRKKEEFKGQFLYNI